MNVKTKFNVGDKVYFIPHVSPTQVFEDDWYDLSPPRKVNVASVKIEQNAEQETSISYSLTYKDEEGKIYGGVYDEKFLAATIDEAAEMMRDATERIIKKMKNMS